MWTHVKAHKKDDSFETKWNNLVDKCAYEASSRDDISNVVKPGSPSIETFFNNKKRKLGN